MQYSFNELVSMKMQLFNKKFNDMKNIKKNPKLLVPTDKTNNLYELTTEEYNKLLIENISKMYKKTTASAISSVKDLKLDERIEQHNQNQSFTTMKDHKEHFQSNRKCRLINPAKSEIGIVSKHYIYQINKSIREK